MLLNLPDLIQKYQMKIRGVIHIGGHHGQEHDSYVQLGIKNLIYFEPMKNSFAILKNKVGPNVQVFNVALGNENGTAKMFTETANQGQSSSILEPLVHVSQYPNIVFSGREDVVLRRFDDFGLEKSLPDFNMVNIDVQGYELEVFKGMENSLTQIDYIFSEVNRSELYKGCPHITELDQFLAQFGFVRKETIWAGGTWGDAFYVKEK